MANHKGMIDLEAARISAREMVTQRKTCEGCLGLRAYPRPMCQAETSPHFRQVRDTYHERCTAYSVKGMAPPPVAKKPEPPPQPRKPAKLVRLRDIDRVVTEDEYDRLMSRNRGRKVGA